MKKELVFDTKEEAQKEANRLNSMPMVEQRLYTDFYFCPLIKRDCDRRCICFSDAKVVKYRGGDKYEIYGLQCKNPMLVAWEL